MQMVKPFGLTPSELPQKFNEAVYTGLIADTGNFEFSRPTLPFIDAALLVKNGLKPEEIYKKKQSDIPDAGFSVPIKGSVENTIKDVIREFEALL